jgi:hypothetical protein
MSKQGKEVRPKETPNHDPNTSGFSYDEFFNNRLSLPDTIKNELNDAGLDWRFINAAQFRNEGNVHRSHWKPYKFLSSPDLANAEGYLTRGDLILATRPKDVSKAHRKFLNERNKLQKNQNKADAQKMRQALRDNGMDGKARVFEGYEDND